MAKIRDADTAAQSIAPLIRYLTVLREGRGLSRAIVAEAIDVPVRTFQDWETGKEPRAYGFLRWLDYMGIPEEHLRLFAKPGITVAEAQALAENQLRLEKIRALAEVDNIDERVQAAVRRLAPDPVKLAFWLGYADGLVQRETPETRGH